MSNLATRVFRPEYALLLLVAGLGLALPACDSSGNFIVLGYSTASIFDTKYKTIRVPIFQNMTIGYRGMEFDLTKAVVTEIEERTHLKVVECNADLELTGKITVVVKSVILPSPANTIRDGQLTMTVEVVLKDLRTGQILSKAPRRPGTVVPEEIPLLKDNPALQSLNTPIGSAPTAPGSVNADATMMGPAGPAAAPTLPILAGTPGPTFGSDEPVDPTKKPAGLPITATGFYIPEMGQSTTTAQQGVIHVMGRQIVNMMEMGW